MYNSIFLAFRSRLLRPLQPISFDVPTIDVALQTVADNDVKLLLGFQRRFDSNFRTIREKVRVKEKLLRVHRYKIVYEV